MTTFRRLGTFGRRATALGASAALALVVATSVVATTAGSATATSTKHHAAGLINGSPAVENSVRASFSCDDSSGQWSFKISGVQIINANHTTPWTTFAVSFIYGKTVLQSHDVSLTQDLHNGLFDGSASGSDGPVNSFCVTASSFKIVDADTSGSNLFMIANIR